VNPETLVRTVEDFLVGARNAVVMEDGAVAFDLAQSKYSIFRGAQQVRAAFVVVRAQCGAAGDRSGSEERSAAFGGAAAGTGASQQVGNLSRTRPAYSHCEAGCAIDIRASIATRTGEKPSRHSVAKLTTAMDLERSFGPSIHGDFYDRASLPLPCWA